MKRFLFISNVVLISSCTLLQSTRTSVQYAKLTTKTIENNKQAEAKQEAVKEPKMESWKSLFRPTPTASQRILLKNEIKKLENPNDIDKLLKKARTYLALGDLLLAEASYNALLNMDKYHKSAALEMALIHIRKNQLDKAFDWLNFVKDIIDEEEKVSQSFLFQYKYTFALAYDKSNELEKSHKILTDLIALDKNFIPGYTALASSYIKDGKLKIAKHILKKALDSSTEDPSIYNLLGVISEKKGQFEKSARWYDKSIEKSNDFVPALVNKSILEIRNYNLDRAELLLKKSISIQPNHVQSHVVLAILYAKKNRFEDARSLLTKALEIDPHYSETRYHLGLLNLYGLNKPYEALRLFHEAVQAETGNGYSKITEFAKSYIEDIKNINNMHPSKQ